ncbi:MAG: Fumarate hydratase class II, partial [uncultured Gemmatimonadetes bacterium]
DGYEHFGLSHRARFAGRNAGSLRRPVRLPDTAGGGELSHQQPALSAALHPCAGHHQEGRRAGQRPDAAAGRHRRRRHRARGRRGDRRAPGLAVRAGHLPDGKRHQQQHERERGDRHPRHAAAGRRQPRASQRPRQHGAKLQRRDPHGHARQRPRRHPPGPGALAGAAARCPAGQGRRVRRRGQERPHPPDGRHARAPGPGVRWLRQPGGPRNPTREERRRGVGRAGAGRHGRGHGNQRGTGLSRAGHPQDQREHGAGVPRGREPLRGPGRQGRVRIGLGRAEHAGGVADEDRQRHPLAGERPHLGAGRDRASRHPAGLQHHAGQGEPGDERGHDDALRAGDGEPRGDHRRRPARQLRAERDDAGDGAQLSRVRLHPGEGLRRLPDQRGGGDHRQTRALPRAPGAQPVHRHGPQRLHRLRRGRGGRQGIGEELRVRPRRREAPRPADRRAAGHRAERARHDGAGNPRWRRGRRRRL